jgi:anti-sigma28 factor (negative regulator of flagellin synthesis)
MKTTGRRSLLLLALLAALTNDGFGFSSSTKSRRTVGGWIVAVGEERATISLRATEKENAKDENSNNKNNQFDLFSNNANDVDPKCAAGEGNAKRKTRSDFEQKARKRFATGEELKNLRQDLESFGHNLQWAEAMKDEERIRDLKKAIKEGQNRDPEYIYNKSFQIIAGAKAMQDASKEEKEALVEKWSKLAEAARECLPQFQLEGLFVGR